MGKELEKSGNFTVLKEQFSDASVRRKFEEVLGRRAPAFISSVLTAVSGNGNLQQADPRSVLMSAMIAATLDLPINPTLGFAAIVPYNDRKIGQVAQFQIMTKGLVQLAERSGQYEAINNAIVYDGQLVREDPFTGDYEFDYYAKKSDTIIGYMAYIRLKTGFEKYFYMTKAEVERHGKTYSQTYKRGFGVWADDFDKMALKTVLKLLLSRYGLLSVEMQSALMYDQAVVRGDVTDLENAEVQFLDNSKTSLTDSLAVEYMEMEEADIVTEQAPPPTQEPEEVVKEDKKPTKPKGF